MSKQFPTREDAEAELRSGYAGSRILLVEDNEINREVIEGLLVDLGLIVDAAENGVEAVSSAQQHAYDLVLMDIQMPEMDGLEATRLIRSMPNHIGLPILAMTATLFEEERQACINVGMVDFVEKPVRPQNLYSILIRWLPRTKRASEGASLTDHVSPEVDNEAALKRLLSEIDGLDAVVGLRNMSGDVDAYLRILRKFQRDHEEDVAEIKRALTVGDGAQIRALAHALKGAAGTLGLSTLQQAAWELEDHLRSIEKEKLYPLEVSELSEPIQTELDRLQGALEQIVEDRKEPEVVEVNVTELHYQLEQIQALLMVDDASVNTVFEQIRPLLKHQFGEAMGDLQQQIENFDYPLALKSIQVLVGSSSVGTP